MHVLSKTWEGLVQNSKYTFEAHRDSIRIAAEEVEEHRSLDRSKSFSSTKSGDEIEQQADSIISSKSKQEDKEVKEEMVDQIP